MKGIRNVKVTIGMLMKSELKVLFKDISSRKEKMNGDDRRAQLDKGNERATAKQNAEKDER